MTPKEIIAHRLLNQQVAETKFTKPEEIVSYLGAMQSQDWAMAKWAIGLRIPGLKEKDFEKAFNEGKILRTHMMRPTWHFVTPPDIRWMLQLTSARVQAFNASYYRKQNVDKQVFKKCNAILAKTLRDHQYKTRNELNKEFKKAKINTDDLRLTLIMMNAELEGLICSGPRQGKQFTYALLDEKTPEAKPFDKPQALHDLAARYFLTRGPATINDFTWWSGLTVKEAKEGIASLGSKYLHETVQGKEYIFYNKPVQVVKKSNSTFLMPDYDEYGISYKDRSIYMNPKMNKESREVHPHFSHAIVVDGYFGGNWKKSMKGNKHVIDINPLASLSKQQLSAIDRSVKRYVKFFSEE